MAEEDGISGASGVGRGGKVGGASGTDPTGAADGASGGNKLDDPKLKELLDKLLEALKKLIQALTGEGGGDSEGKESGGSSPPPSGGGSPPAGGGSAPPSNKSRTPGGADQNSGAGGTGSPGSPNGGNSGPGQTGNVSGSSEDAKVDVNGDGKDDVHFQGPQAKDMAQKTKEYASEHKAYGDFLANKAEEKGGMVEVELKNSSEIGGNMGNSGGGNGKDGVTIAPDLANKGNLANSIAHELGHDEGLDHGGQLDQYVAKNSDNAPYA